MRLKDISGRWDSMKHYKGINKGIECYIQGNNNRWFFYISGYNSIQDGLYFESKELAKKECEKYINNKIKGNLS